MLGGLVFAGFVAVWLTSALWFFTPVRLAADMSEPTASPAVGAERAPRSRSWAGWVATSSPATATRPRQPTAPSPRTPTATTPRGAGKALATVADIPDGGGLILSQPAVVVTRSGAQVHAFSSVCTHQGCRVDKVSNGTIDCPCHGSVFDAATGKVLAGPAPSPLPAVAVTVRDGQVFSA